ncbi:MAG TPA: substrate-binding domain-containing protein, partial [Fimbriimonadaceae bacterium]|nr:substrate-binding domain-containing protein [Fimbriimonadaceae bacterium]
TVAELNKIWNRDSKINNWKDVRPGFPDKPLKLFGAGEASGTFDYFNEAINGDKKNFRSDYSKSEDDNVLVNGVAGEEGGLGYFGYAYYINNTSKVKIVKVDPGTGPVEPTESTINDGTYQPLSRPIFLYINKKALERPEVMAFMKYALGPDGPTLVKDSGYIPLPKEVMDLNLKHVEEMKTGSAFVGKPMVGIKLADVLKAASGN